MSSYYGPPGGPGRPSGGPARRRRSPAPLIGIGAAALVAAVVVAVLLTTGVLSLNSVSPTPEVTVTVSAPASPQASSPGGPATPSGPASTAPVPPQGNTLPAAEATVLGKGYTPYRNTPVHWDNTATLNVILGTATGSADGYLNWAFFFVDGHYIGTDTKTQSAGITIAWHANATVALTYVLYHPSDPLCCPSAGTATVRYHWTGSHLVPLDPIPGAGNSDPTRN